MSIFFARAGNSVANQVESGVLECVVTSDARQQHEAKLSVCVTVSCPHLRYGGSIATPQTISSRQPFPAVLTTDMLATLTKLAKQCIACSGSPHTVLYVH